MTDTPDPVREVHRALLMRRSGVERLRMASAMFDTARALARVDIVRTGGNAGSADLRVRLFVRTYGRDFDRDTAARIAARLRAGG